VVSDLIARELSPEQVSLLNDLIQSAARYNVNGIEVVVTSVTTEKYMPDFAFLVQKMVKMENLDALFAVGRMENKIYVVARSRTGDVDVGNILTPLGGGGHAYAASASIKGKTLAQVENNLVELLYSKIEANRQARNLMSSPAITVQSEVSCKDAKELLTRYNINALLVTEMSQGKETLCGYITRQVIEKALFHKLENVPVREYMTTELATVGPEADLSEVQEKIIENKQRVLPVLDNAAINGVITRTDLLNILVRQSKKDPGNFPDPLKEPAHARTRNVVKFLKERLSKRLLNMLKRIGEVADEFGYGAYVVGGFVRDLFLYRLDEDVDIVIEGDGIAFAKKYAKLEGARIHTYEKFGTAVIIFPDGYKIDVASARLEYYKFPAALPIVEMSSIKLDLFRRDFTINTLAIQLNSEKFGTLIDFFSARKDIKEKIIRVLHNLSFVEDPTRVFRAIRFEQRFGFTIGKLTNGLIENAVNMNFFEGLSGRRVLGELKQILEEDNPVPAIIRYMKWIVYFLVLIHTCDPQRSEEICSRFELAPRYRKIFCSERFAAEKCVLELARSLPLPNSKIYRKLSEFRTELILYMMAITKQQKIKKAISHYFTDLRRVRVSLKGRDLKKMGVAPGPIYRDILQAALEAKLNGKLKTHKDELDFARKYAQ
jgi:tRNA nucleotidyltransferase (CCA-adding enzyme)